MSPASAPSECELKSSDMDVPKPRSRKTEPADILTEATVRHGRMAPQVMLLVASSARFAGHVDTADTWWHHLVYLAIEIHGIRSVDEALYLGDLLASAPAKDICVEILGKTPTGLLSILRKIRAYPLPLGYYQKLIEAVESDKRLKLLAHSAAVTPDLLDVVSMLPGEVLSTNLIAAVRSSTQAESALYYFDALLKIFPSEDHQRIWQSFRRIEKYEQIGRWFGRWLEKSPAIEAPWLGNSLLRPIQSPRELVEVAKEFENCLRSYVKPMVTGGYYFYRWLGGAPAVISLKKDAFFGWVVSDIEGPSGERQFPPSGKAEIIEQFRNAGFRYRPNDVERILDGELFLP